MVLLMKFIKLRYVQREVISELLYHLVHNIPQEICNAYLYNTINSIREVQEKLLKWGKARDGIRE